MKSTYKIFALLLLTGSGLRAQDFHLAQYDAVSQYLNPALSGIYPGEKGDYRIASTYRSQWGSIASRPFSTAAISYDMPYKRFGLGGYLLSNRAGAGRFGTLNFLASGAYKISGHEGGPHHLSTGLQLGLFYKSFDPSSFTFDSQYSSSSSTGFDENLDDMESFDKTGRVGFDANMGIHYKWVPEDKKVHPYLGLAVYHLPRPNESFTSTVSRVPMRFNVHTGADININERFDVMPNVLYMTQAKATELNVGVTGTYKTREGGTEVSRLLLGINYRTSDALIFQIGMKNENYNFRIGYDYNISALKNYTNGRGGIELSLVLTGFKGKPLFTKGMF